MKVALCISGYLRSFRNTYNSLYANILNNFDCDVFIHTWEAIGSYNLFDRPVIRETSKDHYQEILDIYKPKQIIIDGGYTKNGSKYRKYLKDNRDPNAVFSMFYKIASAHKLARQYGHYTNTNYDAYIRCRADLKFLSPLNYNDVAASCNDNCLYIPQTGHYGGFNDQFAFGNRYAMDIYSSVYDDFNSLVTRVEYVPESLLKKHVVDNNVSVKLTDIKYIILRSNGEIFNNDINSPNPPTFD